MLKHVSISIFCCLLEHGYCRLRFQTNPSFSFIVFLGNNLEEKKNGKRSSYFFFNITNKFLKNKVPIRFDLHQNKSIETTFFKKQGFLASNMGSADLASCEFAKQNALNTTYNNYKSKKTV